MREWRSRYEIYVNRRSNVQNLRTACPTGRDGASATQRLISPAPAVKPNGMRGAPRS
jgi:hypothetical protein